MLRKYLFIFVVFIAVHSQAYAFWGAIANSIPAISKHAKALSSAEIVRLSKLSDEVRGTKKVGKALGKLNLPTEAVEDAFLRIVIHQKKLSRAEAESMFRDLGGVPGFASNLRKIIGNSKVGTAGHLNELKISQAAYKNGFTVKGIGVKFADGLKKAPTDIDILLEKGRKKFAVEAKDYASTTQFHLDKYRADLDTLVEYKKMQSDQVIPIFTMTKRPANEKYLEIMQKEAKKRGVQFLIGSPGEQAEQINALGKIL